MAERRLQLNFRISQDLSDALDEYRSSRRPIPDLSDAARTLLQERLTQLGYLTSGPPATP